MLTWYISSDFHTFMAELSAEHGIKCLIDGMLSVHRPPRHPAVPSDPHAKRTNLAAQSTGI